MGFILIPLRVFLVLFCAKVVLGAKIDLIDCGVDHEEKVMVGDVDIELYAWLGILFYNDEDMNGVRAVTPVVLVQQNFLLANAHDIAQMPVDGFNLCDDSRTERNVSVRCMFTTASSCSWTHQIRKRPNDSWFSSKFKKHARVLLGEGWSRGPGRRVRTYVLHPEYGETYNTLALVYLRDGVHNRVIKPMCPPPEILRDPEFYVVRFKNDYNNLQKEVIPMYYVPPRLCRDFYVASKLYAVKMRPPHVVCACSMEHNNVCVWDGGSMLVTRDVWGRWQLLGFGVRGPGCAGPSRYLDMASYYPWIHEALRRFQPITISKISNHKYVLRAGGVTTSIVTDEGSYVLQRYGVCDESEKEQYAGDIYIGRIYRDRIRLTTDNSQYQFLTYNMTIIQAVEITCMTLELINASASSEMKVRHFCPRQEFGPPCYSYRGTIFDISCYLMFADKCTFEINIWGAVKDMKLIEPLKWRWEEGSYYEDFTMTKVEYRGPSFMTSFGFNALDQSMWLPMYDMYTTTEYDPLRTERTTTEAPPIDGVYYAPPGEQVDSAGYYGVPWYGDHPGKGTPREPTTTKKFFYLPGFLGP